MNRETYPRNIKNMLFRGFLTAPFVLNDMKLTLKTLNEQERDVIEFLDQEGKSKILSTVVASIFSIDQENFLIKRNDQERVTELVTAIGGLGKEVLVKLSEVMSQLNVWYIYEVRNVFRYSLEDESRALWPSYRDQRMNLSEVTGIAGTSLIGLNTHQIRWRIHNEIEDQERQFKMLWGQVKFLASAWVGDKEIKKVSNREKLIEEEEEKRKERILAGDVEYDRMTQLGETVSELERQMRGEKDDFDKFVEKTELDEKVKKVRRYLKEVIFSQESFRFRKTELYTLGDEIVPIEEESDTILDRVIASVNKGSLKASLSLTKEQREQLTLEVKSEVLSELEIKYGKLAVDYLLVEGSVRSTDASGKQAD